MGCTPAKKAPGPPKAPPVDTRSDRTEVKASWLASVYQDPAPLVTLAEANAGWKGLFRNDPVAALAAFESNAKRGDLPARIGGARAALGAAGRALRCGGRGAAPAPDSRVPRP